MYLHIQCESNFCDIVTCGEPVQLKITLVIAQTYSYVHIVHIPTILVH